MSRRVAWIVFGALMIVVGALLATSEPAAGDNCKQLVTSVLDLTNKANIADCLRTGGNWGRVIGTVVGGAGVAIAGLGLLPNRPALKPVADSPSHQNLPNDPCARLAARAHRIHQLDVQRQQLEAEIVSEFHKLVDQAQTYITMYRTLQEAWYQARLCLFSARAINTVWWGGGVVAVAAALQVAAGYVTLAMAGEIPAAAAVTGEAFSTALLTKLKEVLLAAVGTAAALGKDLTGELTPDWIGSPKPYSDFFAETQRKALIEKLQPVATQYAGAATSFNQTVQQWGANRQQDLDAILAEIRTEAAAWNADAASCPDGEGVPPAPPAGSQAPPMQLQLPQVATDFNEPWLMGGAVYVPFPDMPSGVRFQP